MGLTGRSRIWRPVSPVLSPSSRPRACISNSPAARSTNPGCGVGQRRLAARRRGRDRAGTPEPRSVAGGLCVDHARQGHAADHNQHVARQGGGNPEGYRWRRQAATTSMSRRRCAPMQRRKQLSCRKSESTGADLVVLGVDRIQGDSLNFGSVAAAVLNKSSASVLLISDGQASRKD